MKWLILLLLILLALPLRLSANDLGAYVSDNDLSELAYIEPKADVAEPLYQKWLLERRRFPFDVCSCVSYAKAKSGINVGSIGMAKNHPINSQIPAVGAIVVMREKSPAGHLAVVMAITGDTLTISEANYRPCQVTARTISISSPDITGYYIAH